MELIGFSSKDYSRDKSHGINIAGPDFSLTEFTENTVAANKSGLDAIIIIRPVYFTFLLDFYGRQIDPVRVENSLFETEKLKKYDFTRLEEFVNSYLINFLNMNVYGIYLTEEMRPWIRVEVAFMRHCIIYIYKFLNKYNKKWKLIVYHPNHALTPQQDKTQWTMSRILSVPYVDIILVPIYNEYYNNNSVMVDRSKLAQRLNFIFEDNIDLKKCEYCPVLKLEKQVFHSQDNLDKIVLHDFIVCVLYGVHKIFVWSFFNRMKSSELTKYNNLYDAHIKAFKEMNKKKVDLDNNSFYELCAKNDYKPKRILYTNGLLIALFKLNNDIVVFKVNSSNISVAELKPCSYKYEIIKNTKLNDYVIEKNDYLLFSENINNLSKNPNEFKNIFDSHPDPRLQKSNLFVSIIIILTMFLIPFVMWFVSKNI
jgi:hypothetical protein